jgi:hypothetical protein
MADDPFAGYQAPSKQGADPFAGYSPPTASQGWGGYLLNHLAGAGQTMRDVSTVASDAATFGLMDKLFGKQAQADTAGAYQRLGYGAIPAAIGGGLMTGMPEWKAASAIGEAAAPYFGKWAGGVLGSAAAGAPSAALGAYGHEAGWTPDAGDIAKQGVLGGVLSGLGGAAGGVVGRGKLPPAATSDDLAAQAKQAYAPLSNILYDAKSEVHPELDVTDAQNALRDWSGYKWGDASKTSKEVQTLLDKPQLSANDIQQSQSYLKGIAADGRSDPNDALYANYYAGKLQNVLENGVPQTGVPQNWTPPAMPTRPPPAAGQGTMTINGQSFNYANGQWTQPSYAALTKAQGDVLHGRAQDMARLENWQQRAAVTGGPDVGAQAKGFLVSPEGQQFAPPGSPSYGALNTLAGTAAKQDSIPWYVKHLMIAPAFGTLGGEIYQAATGEEHHSPLGHLAIDAGTAAGLAGAMNRYGWLTGTLNRAAQQRAIKAAGSTLSTGAYQAPLTGDPTPWRNALRMMLLGGGGSGAY